MSKVERFAGSMTEGARFIIRGKGEVKGRKAEEEQDFTAIESEPEDKER